MGGGVCAGFSALGVDATDLRVEVVGGDGQAVVAGGLLGPVLVRVTDSGGHPVAGANVQIHQTVVLGAVCPARGRCPARVVADRGQSVAVSDVDGVVSFAPLQESGVVEATNLVVTAGMQGFVSFALTKGFQGGGV
jgi:hypothetical protein